MKLNQHKDMEQIKKYIRGNKERGKEVIAELEKLGGENTFYLRGDDENELYFIDIQNAIDAAFSKSLTGQLILTHPDWEEIELPKIFKDGDVVAVTMIPEGIWIGIFKQYKAMFFESYCSLSTAGEFHSKGFENHRLVGLRLATEEEKQKLFDAIKENGYRWNAEKKELEKLIEPKFEVGDVIQDEDGYKVKITEVNVEDECYEYESIIAKGIGGIAFSEQDDWKLVPNKFDISTLVPFESRVLVRDEESELWYPAIWGLKTDDIDYPYIVVGGISYCQCIPYESNEHLLGTKDDCDEYYKTWED